MPNTTLTVAAQPDVVGRLAEDAAPWLTLVEYRPETSRPRK